jgi:hypothetical protein
MLAYVYVIFAVAFRFIAPVLGSKANPELFAFTPIVASLLYFGYKQPKGRMWMPLALFALGDVVLSKAVYHYALSFDLLFTWAFYAAVLLLGSLLQEKATVARVAGASLTGSIAFFVISNFAVWAAWNMYPKTLAGLGACYVAALPFFRNALAGDLIFTAVLFGVPVLVAQMAHEPARVRVQ